MISPTATHMVPFHIAMRPAPSTVGPSPTQLIPSLEYPSVFVILHVTTHRLGIDGPNV